MKQYFIDHLNTLSLKQREQLIGYTINTNITSRSVNDNTEHTVNTKLKYPSEKRENQKVDKNYKYVKKF